MSSTIQLLDEPVFGWESPDGARSRGSLPEVLACLSAAEILSFDHLRAHQEHAWFAFLVQVAALALNRAGASKPYDSAPPWRAALLSLAGGEAGAWALVNESLDRPAFLQAPVPEGSLAAFKTTLPTPDALDLLITAKNHDVKGRRALLAGADDWVFALISLQTMQGYSGRGNYGVLRMNGGMGNRPVVAQVPSLHWGARFRRDVALLLKERDKVSDTFRYAEDGGVALLWLLPWSGDDGIGLEQLDPWFVEICRRVRLLVREGHLRAVMAASEAARVSAPQLQGKTGDPWTPSSSERSLTVGGGGFTYALMHNLIFREGYEESLAMRESGHLYAATLVRGQGVTEGFHERFVPVPAKQQGFLGSTDERKRVGAVSGGRIEAAKKVRNLVLRPALKALLNGGELERSARQDSRPDRWIAAFEHDIDAEFFPRLWEAAETGTPEENMRAWERFLHERARRQLDAAMAGAPIPEARRYAALAAADRIFEGGFRKQFPDFTKEKPE